MKINYGKFIKNFEVFDIRFPTSLSGDGSDAIHSDPDYSVCYVVSKFINLKKSQKIFKKCENSDLDDSR